MYIVSFLIIFYKFVISNFKGFGWDFLVVKEFFKRYIKILFFRYGLNLVIFLRGNNFEIINY